MSRGRVNISVAILTARRFKGLQHDTYIRRRVPLRISSVRLHGEARLCVFLPLPRLPKGKNRMAHSACMFPASVVRSEASPKAASEPTSTGLRPIRSASRPPATAPSRSPAPLAAKSRPNQNGDGPNSARPPCCNTGRLHIEAFTHRRQKAK